MALGCVKRNKFDSSKIWSVVTSYFLDDWELILIHILLIGLFPLFERTGFKLKILLYFGSLIEVDKM